MTAYKARLSGKTSKTGNKKDGPTNGRRRDDGDEWIAAGFEWIPPKRSVYTYGQFRIGPDFYQDEMGNMRKGLVATCADLETPIHFAYGTPPEDIATRLDEEAKAINIGPEIDIDLWMTRPQAAARQSTPAAKELVSRYHISLALAGEIILARGE